MKKYETKEKILDEINFKYKNETNNSIKKRRNKRRTNEIKYFTKNNLYNYEKICDNEYFF